jgi:hypothetical protein
VRGVVDIFEKASGHRIGAMDECERCGEAFPDALDAVRRAFSSGRVSMFDNAMSRVSPCRGRRLGAVNVFEYRRPTIRQLLEARR